MDYHKSNLGLDDDAINSSPKKPAGKRRPDESASDLDFAAAGDSEGDEESDSDGAVDPRGLQAQKDRTPSKGKASKNIPTPQNTSASNAKSKGTTKF